MHNMQDGKSTKFMNTGYMCDIYCCSVKIVVKKYIIRFYFSLSSE